MACASQISSTATTAGKEDEIGSRIDATSQTNSRVEDESPHDVQQLEEKIEEQKKELTTNGCNMEAVINGEKPDLNDEKQAPLHERLNGDSKDENQRHEKSFENSERGQNCVSGNESSISHEKDDETVKTTQKIAELKTESELKNHDPLIKETVTKIQKTTTDDIEIKENTTPPRPKPIHRHSPNSGNPERKSHTGGCHKFFDEESRAEYMKIKSEVTGEAETSDSEEEEEALASEHSHPGRHTSPDSKTKAEYRKIKYEVTGEALTSESEDENCSEGKQQPDEAVKESSEEWMDVFGNGLLKRRILREGKGRDTRPDRGQIVMVRTAGRLTDGTPVDWNQCVEFILGEGEVIQAWDVGIALVELNEVCELVTDARYAYGEQGRSGDQPIPPNAKITYEIELLAVRDGPDMDTMIDEDRIKIGDKKKELGNDLFSRGDYAAAINCYQRAIKYLTPSSDENVQALRIKCWNNLAATQLKIKAYSAALASCQQVLTSEPDNVKALFRKGKVLAAQGELKEAISFTKKASQNEPGNKTIRTELANLRRQLTSQTQQEKNMYEKMVGGLMENDQNSSKTSIFPWSFVVGAAVVVLGGIVAALYVNKH